MKYLYNYHKDEEDLNLYWCEICGIPLLGAGKVELFFWTRNGPDKGKVCIKVRRCDDCTREEILDEINPH